MDFEGALANFSEVLGTNVGLISCPCVCVLFQAAVQMCTPSKLSGRDITLVCEANAGVTRCLEPAPFQPCVAMIGCAQSRSTLLSHFEFQQVAFSRTECIELQPCDWLRGCLSDLLIAHQTDLGGQESITSIPGPCVCVFFLAYSVSSTTLVQ